MTIPEKVAESIKRVAMTIIGAVMIEFQLLFVTHARVNSVAKGIY